MFLKTNLQNLIKEKLSDYMFMVVSNRQPYIHTFKKNEVEYIRGAGGVISALDPVMRACGGTWVAFGNGDADKIVSDKNGKIQVPPNDPSYTLKRVWLSKEEVNGYYYGYSNEALWPLCHMVFQRPTFRTEDWEYYVNVNKKFAKAVADEIGSKKAFIWVQDYHFCLLPKFLKEMLPNQLIIAHFWHIPWPNHEAFRICPQKKEILEGLLASDLLGFHIRYHCNNFIETVDRELECKIDREQFSIIRNNHETLIRPYPISVDFQEINDISQSSEVSKAKEYLTEEYRLSGLKIVVGLDRFDYTKGIPERLMAMDRLFEKHPELKGKVVFVQMGEISRLHIPRYKDLNDRLNALVEQINWKHSTNGWKPVILGRRHLSVSERIAFYSMGDVCIVSSLHDGMNLVAKEYISTHTDNKGVLILSKFTGASRELNDAIMINPYDTDQFSENIYEALKLSEKEVKKRMTKMREVVQSNNIFHWAGKVILELMKFDFKENKDLSYK